MTPWPGAITLTALAFLAVAIAWQVWLWRRDARRWRRHCATRGGEARALRELRADERMGPAVKALPRATVPQATVLRFRHADGRRVQFTNDGDAA